MVCATRGHLGTHREARIGASQRWVIGGQFGINVQPSNATLAAEAPVKACGVHSNMTVNLTLGPSPVDAALFCQHRSRRSDRDCKPTAKSVIATEFATVLVDRDGPRSRPRSTGWPRWRGMGRDNPPSTRWSGSARSWMAAPRRSSPLSTSPGIVGNRAPRFISVLNRSQVAMGYRSRTASPCRRFPPPKSKSISPIRGSAP